MLCCQNAFRIDRLGGAEVDIKKKELRKILNEKLLNSYTSSIKIIMLMST